MNSYNQRMNLRKSLKTFFVRKIDKKKNNLIYIINFKRERIKIKITKRNHINDHMHR
jgi:hypothetical protein